MNHAERFRSAAFWVLASTFACGLAVAPYVRECIRDPTLFLFRLFSAPLKNYAPLFIWSTLLTYPLMCWTAAFFLNRNPGKGGRILAIIHSIAGCAWMLFVVYIYVQWGRTRK